MQPGPGSRTALFDEAAPPAHGRAFGIRADALTRHRISEEGSIGAIGSLICAALAAAVWSSAGTAAGPLALWAGLTALVNICG